jgi:hypothetical protein
LANEELREKNSEIKRLQAALPVEPVRDTGKIQALENKVFELE